MRNVVKDLTAEISEKVPLTVARARVCGSLTCCMRRWCPTGARRVGEISAGEQVMVYRCASPYTADRRCLCSPCAFDTTLTPPRSQSAGEQLLDQSLDWRVRDLRRRRRQPVDKPARFRVGCRWARLDGRRSARLRRDDAERGKVRQRAHPILAVG